MASVSEMQGVPAHLEFLHKDEDDVRRHKTRCVHYKNGYCKYYKRKCYGSRFCEVYKESKIIIEPTKANVEPIVKIPEFTDEELELKSKFSILGTLVWNSKINNAGEIIKVDGKYITIKYDNGAQITYDINVFVKSKNVKNGVIRILNS